MTMLRILGLLALVVGTCGAQEKPLITEALIPPDLTHVSRTGCHIDGHATEPKLLSTLNAKTGLAETITVPQPNVWEVTPFAVYEPLPDGTHRDEWTPKVALVRVAEGITSLGAAADRCDAWMKKVKELILDAHHKAGHTIGEKRK